MWLSSSFHECACVPTYPCGRGCQYNLSIVELFVRSPIRPSSIPGGRYVRPRVWRRSMGRGSACRSPWPPRASQSHSVLVVVASVSASAITPVPTAPLPAPAASALPAVARPLLTTVSPYRLQCDWLELLSILPRHDVLVHRPAQHHESLQHVLQLPALPGRLAGGAGPVLRDIQQNGMLCGFR